MEGIARSTERPKIGRKRWFVATVLFGTVLSAFFDRINVSVLFTDNDFQHALGVGNNPALLGLLMTSFIFAYGVSGVLLSFIGDTMLGLRKSLILLTLLWSVFMFGMGLTSSFLSMILFRVLLGISEGPQFSLSAKFTKSWFPTSEQGLANAMWAIGSPLGSAIGFPFIILINSMFGWRATFYVLAAISLFIVLPLVSLFLKDRPEDYASISPEELQYIKQGRREVLGATETFRQGIKEFMSRFDYWLVVLLFVSYLSLLWGINSWLPTYLREVRHFNITSLGFYSSLPFFTMMIGELVGSALSDRWMKRSPICLVGMLGVSAVFYAVSLVPSPILAALLISVGTLFLGTVIPTSFALLLQILPERASATGYGICNGIGNLCGAFAPFVMGLIIGPSHNFNNGLSFLVLVGLVGSIALLPLMKK
ncbi:MFS transporter [Kyrpidia sp.]|uniref:MFS transporter n=1 Tax=Kyrpidia sp. TaxID=2073077 RepID=UPI0025891E2E|nr:MFS transporter [Kyrpidia sp.]MCL6577441.1 MFS transporter [Kyrpidia sp.]